MTPLQQHESRKPTQPKPLKDMTQAEYAAWSKALSLWLWERDGIIAAEMVKAMDTPGEVREKVMREKACLPRADYEWRDIPTRPSRAKKPAWSGPEYMAQAKRKSRAKSPQQKSLDLEKRKAWDKAYREKIKAAVAEVIEEKRGTV